MVPLFSRVPTFVALEMPPQHIAREVGVTGAGGACGAGGGQVGGPAGPQYSRARREPDPGRAASLCARAS